MNFHHPSFSLRELKIEVTHRCLLSCIHCSSDATPSCLREMSEQDCLRILEEAASLGAKEVAFSGGEPLLWPGLEKAVEAALKRSLRVAVYTSGNALDTFNKLNFLKSGGVDKCIFSLFGASQVSHERITRRNGSFKTTLEAISFANQIGLTAEIHFVPITDNYKELEGLVSLGESRGITRISVLRFVPQGRGSLLCSHVLNKIQNFELKRTIERLKGKGFDIRTGSPYNFLLLNDQPQCCSGIDRLIIGPDLKIYPCDAFKQIEAKELVGSFYLSSLNGSSLGDCWNKSAYLNAIREYLTTPFAKPCASCKNLEKCLSGCLAQKVIAHGNLQKRPDPMCLMA